MCSRLLSRLACVGLGEVDGRRPQPQRRPSLSPRPTAASLSSNHSPRLHCPRNQLRPSQLVSLAASVKFLYIPRTSKVLLLFENVGNVLLHIRLMVPCLNTIILNHSEAVMDRILKVMKLAVGSNLFQGFKALFRSNVFFWGFFCP